MVRPPSRRVRPRSRNLRPLSRRLRPECRWVRTGELPDRPSRHPLSSRTTPAVAMTIPVVVRDDRGSGPRRLPGRPVTCGMRPASHGMRQRRCSVRHDARGMRPRVLPALSRPIEVCVRPQGSNVPDDRGGRDRRRSTSSRTIGAVVRTQIASRPDDRGDRHRICDARPTCLQRRPLSAPVRSSTRPAELQDDVWPRGLCPPSPSAPGVYSRRGRPNSS